MVRYVVNPRGVLSIHVSSWALSGASQETRISGVRRSSFARKNVASVKAWRARKVEEGKMFKFGILLFVCCAMWSSSVLAGKDCLLMGRQKDAVLELESGKTYSVTAQYIVPRNCVLKIPEDVSIVFNQDVGISVDGTLIASGTIQKPVCFVGKQSRPGFWSGITMGGNGSKVDLYGAVISDAKCGWKTAWNSGAVARCCAFVNNSQGICFFENGGRLEGCYVAKNTGVGVWTHLETSTFSHCTITENEGCGIFGWGSARLTACILSKNLSHGISCSRGKCFATGCIIENNREFDVRNEAGCVWDFGANYWGEASTRLLKSKGIAANLPKVEDKLDGHGDGIVDLTDFLLKPPKDCGATEYPGTKVRSRQPIADDQGAKVAEENDETKTSDKKSVADEEKTDDDESAEREDAEGVEVEEKEGDSNDKGDPENQSDVEDPMFVRPTDVPNDVATAKAVKVMVELCGDDQKAVKAGKMSHSEFAVKLMSYVRKTDNVAVKFVLLRNAYKRLLMARSVSSAQKLFDKVEIKYGARFAVAMAKASDENLKALLKNAKTASAAQTLSKRIDELSVSIAKIKVADDDLKKSPSNMKAKMDKAANSIKIGDWQAAFALYAGMDNERGKIACWELSKPDERSNDYTAEKIGDYWWSTIADAKEDSAFFRSVSRHAAYWYRQAMKEGGMSEMKVELVKKRIDRTPANKMNSSAATNIRASKATEKVDVNNGKGECTLTTYVLIQTAEHGGVDCRYTQQIPSGSWLTRWFDDSRWLRGHTEIDRDVWDTSDVWIRVLFDCPVDPKSIEKFILRYHVDDDIEVWINEMPAYKHYGYHREYFDIPLKIDRRKIRQKGNIVCVHAHDTAGGKRNYNSMYVDFGLSIVAPKKQ